MSARGDNAAGAFVPLRMVNPLAGPDAAGAGRACPPERLVLLETAPARAGVGPPAVVNNVLLLARPAAAPLDTAPRDGLGLIASLRGAGTVTLR